MRLMLGFLSQGVGLLIEASSPRWVCGSGPSSHWRNIVSGWSWIVVVLVGVPLFVGRTPFICK